MQSDQVWEFVSNPAWRPFSSADMAWFVGLGAVAVVLVLLTIWTYVGASASTPKRVGTLIALRLFALLLAVLLAIRPGASITDIPKLPSTLLIVVDASESMSIKDEGNFSRWEVIQQTLEKCGPLMDQMREDQQTTIHLYHFSKDFEAERDQYSADVKPDGKRTDFGTMLSKLYEKHQTEQRLRGLVIVSDGRDNGFAKPALPEMTRWRGVGCPVYCFSVGKPGTAPQEKDISFTSINPDPSPVAVKADLKIKAKMNAQGFEGQRVKVRLKIEGQPDLTREFELSKSTDNDIEFETKAPDQPGEVKVSLELLDPPANQVTKLNDQIETFLTVTKEGVRVLVVSKDGWELNSIRRALATDKRFDYVEAIRATEAPGTPEDAKRYNLAEQRYDVIVLGDVSPKMLTAVRPELLVEIRNLVRDKGVGLMMTGGAYSLGGTAGIPGADGWNNSPIKDILPVNLPSDPPRNPPGDNADATFSVEPTDLGLTHYLLRLLPEGKRNLDAWALLNAGHTRIQGFNLMGTAKPTAAVLARANDKRNGEPLLVAIELGKARVLASGLSDTWLWTQPGNDEASLRTTSDYHARFWKQTILWLAHQDEVEGNVYVRPEFRRLVVNGRQSIKMGMRDKRGDDVPEADFRYQVIRIDETADDTKAKRADRDSAGGARIAFEAKESAEYKVVVWGKGKDEKGEAIEGRAEARYIVFPEVSDEMLQPGARPEFMLELENAANGTAMDVARRVDSLPRFLEQLKENPPRVSAPRPKPYPEWRRDRQKFFLPGVLVFFVLVLGFEWGLRRAWGMV